MKFIALLLYKWQLAAWRRQQEWKEKLELAHIRWTRAVFEARRYE